MPEVEGPPPGDKADGLDADQVAAMQTMDNAGREGVLSAAEAGTIEELIRQGKTAGARKRVTLARRRYRS